MMVKRERLEEVVGEEVTVFIWLKRGSASISGTLKAREGELFVVEGSGAKTLLYQEDVESITHFRSAVIIDTFPGLCTGDWPEPGTGLE